MKDRWFVWCDELGLPEESALEIKSSCTCGAAEKFIDWALELYLLNFKKDAAKVKLMNEGILVSVKEPPKDEGYFLIEIIVKGFNKFILHSDFKDINHPTKFMHPNTEFSKVVYTRSEQTFIGEFPKDRPEFKVDKKQNYKEEGDKNKND
jgi:hypothetical protein